MIGKTLGHYEITGMLGKGGMGEVYRGRDARLDRDVALKLRKPGVSTDLEETFIEEGRRLARIRHPNVLSVYGAERHDGRVGLWTEIIDGTTLEQVIASQGRFGAHEAALIGIDLCRAIAAVHASGLVHRDIKSTNVMRERGGRIVLMDFGLVSPASAGEESPSSR